MKPTYQITLRDVHEYEVERADATMKLFGTLEFFDDRFSITYREEEGDLAGCTTVVTCVDGSLVTVCRTGPFETELTIEQGRRHTTLYNTEYGSMLMGVYGESVESAMDETGGKLDFTYTIDISGDFVSRNHLQITVKEII